MKIVFTHGYFLAEDPKEQLIMRPYPPLGILYVSAYLEANGYPNNVFDSTFSSIDSLQKYLQEEEPDVVAIYTNLMTKLNVPRLIRFIKNWAHTDGSRVGDKIVLNNYLTHSDIASVISTSRQSVNVLLNELRDSGMLFYNRKHIELNALLAAADRM